jgi:hypothetical protein
MAHEHRGERAQAEAWATRIERFEEAVALAPSLVVVEESVQLRHHPSTGAHHDATNIVIVGGLVGDEDAVVVESAVGHEHVEGHVQRKAEPKRCTKMMAPHDGRFTPRRRMWSTARRAAPESEMREDGGGEGRAVMTPGSGSGAQASARLDSQLSRRGNGRAETESTRRSAREAINAVMGRAPDGIPTSP